MMLKEVLIMHFQLYLKTKILNLEMFSSYFKKYNIEFRRGNAGGGNQLRQPYLKSYLNKNNLNKFPRGRPRAFFWLLYWKLSEFKS